MSLLFELILANPCIDINNVQRQSKWAWISNRLGGECVILCGQIYNFTRSCSESVISTEEILAMSPIQCLHLSNNCVSLVGIRAYYNLKPNKIIKLILRCVNL